MKKILLAFAFICSTSYAFAQYSYIETGANGNTVIQGTYNTDPGLVAGDSKNTVAIKLAAVYKVGVWKYWHENGSLTAEEHYDPSGNRTGVWKTWNLDGTVATEINFTTGMATYYHANGAKAEEGGINSLMQQTGAWKGWHANGQLNYTGSFDANGIKTGVWNFYDSSGNSIGTENH